MLHAVRNHFRYCIDSELLRKHNLISPEDFMDVHIPPVPPPSGDFCVLLPCMPAGYCFYVYVCVSQSVRLSEN